MNWYRIKTVLIFLFLAINIFLAALLGIEGLSKTRAEKERISAAAEALRNNGVTVSAEVTHKTPRLGTLTLENPKAEPEELAERILGGKATRLGDTWRREGRTLTFLDSGFVYDSGAAPLPMEKDSVKAMAAALREMGFSMEYAVGTAGDTAAVFTQEVDGAPLIGCVLSVYPGEGGTIARMEGAWAEIVESGKEKARISSAANALLSFLREGKTGSTVTGVSCGYAVLLAEQGYRTADAVPVWQVETADGKRYQYDAR